MRQDRSSWCRVPAFLIACMGAIALSSAQDDCTWSALVGPAGTGINGTHIYTLTAFDDGTGEALYVGGEFSAAGGVNAPNIARWNGAQWAGLNGGTNGAVQALAVFDDGSAQFLFVGGSFSYAGGSPVHYIARWDGAQWASLASGTNGTVSAMAVYDDGAGPDLYAAGAFTTAGGLAASRFARWDGSAWSAPPGGGFDSTVNAMVVFNDGNGQALYAAGNFSSAGGQPAARIARWDGTSWMPLGTGLNSNAYALAVRNNGNAPVLYVGGNFTSAGGIPANYVASWNGAQWSALGTGAGALVMALHSHPMHAGADEYLFVGGSFVTAGELAASRIACFDGNAWLTLGTGVNSRVRAIATYDDGTGPALFVGGDFTTAGGTAVGRIARWACTPACPPDLNDDGTLDFFDVQAFLGAFAAHDPLADFAADGNFDFFDVQAFLNLYSAGCS